MIKCDPTFKSRNMSPDIIISLIKPHSQYVNQTIYKISRYKNSTFLKVPSALKNAPEMEGSFSVSSCIWWNWSDLEYFFWPTVLSFSALLETTDKQNLASQTYWWEGTFLNPSSVSVNICFCLQMFFSGSWRVNIIKVKSFIFFLNNLVYNSLLWFSVMTLLVTFKLKVLPNGPCVGRSSSTAKSWFSWRKIPTSWNQILTWSLFRMSLLNTALLSTKIKINKTILPLKGR